MVSHAEDAAEDCHYVMEQNMTVFGFGRSRADADPKYLDALPGYFTIGFQDVADHQTLAQRIRSAYKPVNVVVGSGEGSTP